jgi:SAM-dependent methyltransferase
MAKQMSRLHLGCGVTTPSGWVNVDGSWNARLARHAVVWRVLRALRVLPREKFDVPWSSDILIHDVRKPLPFPNSSFDGIYASHLLEHLNLEEGKRLLRECFRVLQPNGVLRMVVPDLEAIVREYLGEKPFGELSGEMEMLPPADRLNRRLLLRSPEPSSGGIVLRTYTALKDLHSHKWMYDANSLIIHFQQTGFAEVREMRFHESRIPGIRDIEQASRVLNGEGICIEGVKPDVLLGPSVRREAAIFPEKTP